MAAFVLVHSPLVGAATWRPVAAELRRLGHPVVVPELSALADLAPPFLPKHTAELVAAVRGSAHGGDSDLVLAGHSGAGPRLPALGDALGRAGFTVEAYVFVDAGLPADGRTPRQTAPPDFRARLDELTDASGRLPPWPAWYGPGSMAVLVPDAAARALVEAGCRPVPAAYFDEAVAVPPAWAVHARRGYVEFTYADEAEAARADGWAVEHVAGGHLHLVNEPAATVDAMLTVTRAALA